MDIVVTTSVLGAVVQDLVGDRATVTVLMGNGVDPHDWSPSAQDIETVDDADLVVANGLGLEGADSVLAQAEADGVPVFGATDHVTPRIAARRRSEPDRGRRRSIPHFWVDPIAMRDVVDALARCSANWASTSATAPTDLEARLEASTRRCGRCSRPCPRSRRRLVTGHESMGYFADRYGFQLVGAVIPGLSSQGEVSARELAASRRGSGPRA